MIDLRETGNNLWLTLAILAVFLIFAALKKVNSNKFEHALNLLWTRGSVVKHIFESKKINYFALITFINSLLVLSLFIVLNSGFIPFYQSDGSFSSFLVVFVTILVFFSGKFLVEKIIGILFEIDTIISHQVKLIFMYRNLALLTLFPGVLLLAFSNLDPFWISISFSILAVFVFLWGIIELFFKYRKLYLSEWFYFILYLCSLKIAPYIILYKVIRLF
ncbi:MAG: DUF4271 domain-containing protein [Bacteroidota bacterium]